VVSVVVMALIAIGALWKHNQPLPDGPSAASIQVK
jgi:hypothetical protein